MQPKPIPSGHHNWIGAMDGERCHPADVVCMDCKIKWTPGTAHPGQCSVIKLEHPRSGFVDLATKKPAEAG